MIGNRKSGLAILWLLATCMICNGQVIVNDQNINDLNIQYVELVGYDIGMFKKNLVVVVDYGQKTKWSEAQTITGEDGKPQKFESMTGALNFMNANGWDYLDAYLVSVQGNGGGSVYHYILKRKP